MGSSKQTQRCRILLSGICFLLDSIEAEEVYLRRGCNDDTATRVYDECVQTELSIS